MKRRCWTCQNEHDLDEACSQSSMARARKAAGGGDDLFDDAQDAPKFGPVFTATYDCDDECCGDGIESGQSIRGYEGGWIHASKECEGMATA